MLKFFKTLDRRIIFVFMALAVIIPTAFNVKFKVVSSPMTDKFAEVLKGLEKGSTVLISADYDPGSQAELQPMTLAFMKYCFDNDINVMTMALWPLGSELISSALNNDRIYIKKDKAVELMKMNKDVYFISKEKGSLENKLKQIDGKYYISNKESEDESTIISEQNKYYVKGLYSLYENIEYGKEYLDLGYKVGGLIVIQDLVNDFEKAIKVDARDGKPIRSYEISKNISSLKDFDAVFTISSGNMGIKEWVVYGNGGSGVKVLSGVTAVSAPEFLPYLTSKQLSGMLAGLAGAAEFEAATDYYEGEAVKGMAAQSFAHLVIIIFIIIGNLVYLVEKYSEKR